jgi:predicted outer membrane protein
VSSNRTPCSAADRALALAALAGLALAGCASREPPPPPRPAPLPAPLPAVAALSPAVYFQLATAASLFAVRASELASGRASSAALRDTARRIADDQRGVASQLSFAGRRLDLLPSASLPPPMVADLERLNLSPDFDSDYRRLVGAALERSLDAHEAFARAGASPTLRPVAGMAAPATRRDLEALGRR